MTKAPDLAIAETADRHQSMIVLAFLAMALNYIAAGATLIAPPEIGTYIDMIRIGMAVVTVGLILPVLLWKVLQLPKEARHLYFRRDGYVAQSMIRAHKVSWAITFVFMAGLESVLGQRFNEIPGQFFIDLVLAVMLSSMGIAFFLFNRGDDDLDGEEDSGA